MKDTALGSSSPIKKMIGKYALVWQALPQLDTCASKEEMDLKYYFRVIYDLTNGS